MGCSKPNHLHFIMRKSIPGFKYQSTNELLDYNQFVNQRQSIFYFLIPFTHKLDKLVTKDIYHIFKLQFQKILIKWFIFSKQSTKLIQ